MSWGSKARQLSRTARQIWLHWEAPVISTVSPCLEPYQSLFLFELYLNKVGDILYVMIKEFLPEVC